MSARHSSRSAADAKNLRPGAAGPVEIADGCVALNVHFQCVAGAADGERADLGGPDDDDG